MLLFTLASLLQQKQFCLLINMHILSDVVSFVGGKCYKATQLFPHESSFAFSEAVVSNGANTRPINIQRA